MFSEEEVAEAFRRRTGLELVEHSRLPARLPLWHASAMFDVAGANAPHGEFHVYVTTEPKEDAGVTDLGFRTNYPERGRYHLIVGATADRANVGVAWWPDPDPPTEDPGDDARHRWTELTSFLHDL